MKGCPPTQTPTQKFQNEFSLSGSYTHRYLGIVRKDFLSSTNWATKIHDWFNVIENPKIPGIQPTNMLAILVKKGIKCGRNVDNNEEQ